MSSYFGKQFDRVVLWLRRGNPTFRFSLRSGLVRLNGDLCLGVTVQDQNAWHIKLSKLQDLESAIKTLAEEYAHVLDFTLNGYVHSERDQHGPTWSELYCKSYDSIRRAYAVFATLPHKLPSAPEWNSWRAAVSRCCNESDKVYGYYGGVGIEICNEWRHNFWQFYLDMGPSGGLTLERKDNSLGYSRMNCIWATRKVQSNHQRELRTTNRSGYRYVCWEQQTKAWRAEVKGIFLGRYSTADEAGEAVRKYREDGTIPGPIKSHLSFRKRPGATSKYRGVRRTASGRWQATIRRRCLGTFDTELEAAATYNQAAIEEFGSKARVNVLTYKTEEI